MATDIRLKETLPVITDRLVATYAECSGLHHLDHSPLPNRETIISILEDLREVLYPGYGRRQNLHLSNVEYHAGDLLVNLHDQLTEQFARALRHESNDPTLAMEEFERAAQQRAVEFLEGLPGLRRTLADDVQAAYDGDPACTGPTECVFCYPGLEAITVYRIAHELHRLAVPLIPRIMTEHAHSKTGIDIHPGARIGHSFFIDHGTGVVIGETCDIGENVKLYQGVTLGALSFPKDADGKIIRGKKRHPTIENDVVIYANATILGGDTVIGHHAVIGSSVWLTTSVGPYTIVTMEKPNLRFREGSNGGVTSYHI
jgi:serine O-acetyltransferase